MRWNMQASGTAEGAKRQLSLQEDRTGGATLAQLCQIGVALDALDAAEGKT